MVTIINCVCTALTFCRLKHWGTLLLQDWIRTVQFKQKPAVSVVALTWDVTLDIKHVNIKDN